MVERYEVYCLANPLFYDLLDRRTDDNPDFAISSRPVPTGWLHEATDTWLHYAPAAGWR
ncbi:MAG TPA: hypothetical protein VLJ59_13400 [Mycobacteriales bacterium]|nr:hypothetical protein [Mycobacteriales bacterium]